MRRPCPQRLLPWLRRQAGDPSLEIVAFARLAGGQSNLTFRLDVRGVRGPRRLLLRCDPVHGPQEPYDMGAQFGLFQALARTDVPVPAALWLERDPGVIGRAFFVSEFVPADPVGRLLDPSDPLTPARTQSFVAMLARIHAADWRGAGLADCTAVVPESALPALIDRELRYFAQVPSVDDLQLFERARSVLHEQRPERVELCLNHGDCSLNNYLFQGASIAAVVDWELAIITDPLYDVGFYCAMIYRFQADCAQAVLDRQRAAFLEAYEAMSGRSLASLAFWEVFANYRNALSWTQAAFAGQPSGYPHYKRRLEVLRQDIA